MPILVTCDCGKQFQAKDENIGRRFSCPNCGRELIVPKGEVDPYNAPPDYEGFESRTSGKAIASLVLGILSFFCTIFTGLPAIILGAMGLSDIAGSKGRVGGKGMAISGIVTGSLGTVLVGCIALLLPAVQAAREAARRAQCVNNFKQMGLAFHNFESSKGQFPAAAITAPDGTPLLSWRVAILPYIEEDTLYKQFKLDEPWDSPNNKPLIAKIPKVYLCPSDPTDSQGVTHYQVIVGPGTMFDGEKGAQLREITDGTSNTILAVEGMNSVPWTKPDDINIASVVGSLKSNHPGGVNVLMADGSVKFFKTSVNQNILKALSTKNGGEVISPNAY